ncbi:MAG: isoprenylcysteine carboxylmethyltransferase family protein [Planctomycetaceae bacterium]|nr:isoprenylcysteine carboxylmethyltransferase family protein [Planctomycetaceae bacterium]
MTENDVFRLLLAASFLVMGPIGGYFRYQSNKSGESLDRRREGWPMLIGLRLLGVLLLVGFLGYLARPDWFEPLRLPLPTSLRVAGVVIGAGAMVLFFATLRNLGRNLTDTVVTRREHTLVTTGPYRYVRHPFYVAYLLSIIGTALVAANGYFLILGLPVFVLLYLRTSQEEAELVNRFGDEYRQYMRRTGRFWPRLWK